MNIVVGCELFIEPTQFAELATWFQILEERRLRINHSDVDVAQTPLQSLFCIRRQYAGLAIYVRFTEAVA